MSVPRFIGLMSALLWGISAAGAGDDLGTTFRNQYPAAAAKLEAATRTISAEASEQSGPESTISCRYFLAEDRQLIINDHSRWRGKPASWSNGFCRTPDYYFRVHRETPERPYQLNVLEQKPSAKESLMIGVHLWDSVYATFQVVDVPVSRLIASPSLKIQRCREIKEQGSDPRRVAVEFTCDDPNHWIKGGLIELAPDFDWSIVRYDLRTAKRAGMNMPDGSRVVGAVRPVRRPDGAVVPEEARGQFFYPDGTPEDERVYRFTKFERATTPDSRFLLSSFGLPDSLLSPRGSPGTPTWMILAGSGLVCLVLALGFRVVAPRSPSGKAAA